jgi:serine/threonine-protein kinase
MPSSRGVPHEFDRVIARALAKAPDDRYPSAGDLGRAALAAARGEPVTESERSVAVGPAAPDEAATIVNGSATAITSWDHASHDDDATHVFAEDTGATHVVDDDDPRRLWATPASEPEDGDRSVVRPRRWPYQLAAGVMVFAALVAIGLIAGQVFGGPGGSALRTGPLSEDEVRDTAQAFADAYAGEDPAALRATLARDVVRVLPGGRSEGRDQVVDQYQRQFDGKVKDYDLQDLTVTGGRAGRASGSYRVDRDGGDPYEGQIVFGVVRERGEPRIKLIAATPKT